MSSSSSFTFGERLGLVLLAETSAVSACAIVGLLSYIAVCSSNLIKGCQLTEPPSFAKYSAVSVIRGSPVRWRLSSPAEVYFLNQLSWDLVQAVGASLH